MRFAGSPSCRALWHRTGCSSNRAETSRFRDPSVRCIPENGGAVAQTRALLFRGSLPRSPQPCPQGKATGGTWGQGQHSRTPRERGPLGRINRSRMSGAQGFRRRTVARDLELLQAALNWAVVSGDGKGGMLLNRNPLKGLPLPRNKSPARPVLYEEQYSVFMELARSMDWRFAVAMVLVHETGHRIGTVRQLRWLDIDLANESIRWRAGKAKIGFEHRTPLSVDALAALDEARSHNPAIGHAWVLPSPADAARPCSRNLVKTWWRRAERRSGLDPLKGRGWHSLRRKFATERKHQPLRDLCELGDGRTRSQCCGATKGRTPRACDRSLRTESRSERLKGGNRTDSTEELRTRKSPARRCKPKRGLYLL